MDIEIYGLKIFSNVMKFMSFSQAAREMKLTQPTVSQQIAKSKASLEGNYLSEWAMKSSQLRLRINFWDTPNKLHLWQMIAKIFCSIKKQLSRVRLDMPCLKAANGRRTLEESCSKFHHCPISILKLAYFPVIRLPKV